MMADDPKAPLSSDSVAARVAEILGAAARDARVIVEAALRDASPTPAPPVEPPPAPDPEPAITGDDAALKALGEQLASLTARVQRLESPIDAQPLKALGEQLASLTARVGQLESAIDARLEGLRQVLAPEGAFTVTASAYQPASLAPNPGAAGPTRAERVRAVDLALQGYSRSQIADELRSSMGDDAIEQLLDEVLERA